MSSNTPPTVPGALATPSPQSKQHLCALSVCYFVFSGLHLLVLALGAFYILVGMSFRTGLTEMMSEQEAKVAGTAVIGFGVVIVVIAVLYGVLALLAGFALRRRTHYGLCFTVATITLLSLPLGTVLAAFTLLVLTRPGVKQMFGRPLPE